MKTRRFFWGNALPQALMAAARYHGLPPEDLAYRIYDKRHGFVTRTRRLIVEVDPAAPQRPLRQQPSQPSQPPQRTPGEGRSPATPAPPPRRSAAPLAASARTPPSPRSDPPPAGRSAGATAERPAPRPPTPRSPTASFQEPFVPPDEESELAAAIALGRILKLAGLALTVRVERQADRLLIALGGADEERLRELGEEFLDDLEHLAPRAIRGLAGRTVRCKVDGAGLRGAREEELRRRAERAADQVAASGEAMLLEPLSSADRRIVHLVLVEDPRVTTQSEGFGAEKRIRISPADDSTTASTPG